MKQRTDNRRCLLSAVFSILTVLLILPFSVFGITAESEIEGDINGDGLLSNSDITILIRYLNGWSIDYDVTHADVTNDGKINNRDVIALIVKLNSDDYFDTDTYSVGLKYNSRGDGTCTILGIGEYTDKNIVIPPVSPDGDIVVEIEGSAFSGEEIISVSLPVTVEKIGEQAFYQCSALADVYYNGTEDEWNEINILSGNDVLEGAIKHFNSIYIVHTVTFCDYDGSVIATYPEIFEGTAAPTPDIPTRKGYAFFGWDKDFGNVTSDLTVTALYIEDSEPTVYVGNASALAGEEVEVAVYIKNNPGILTMLLTLEYDDTALSLIGVENGSAFRDVLTLTSSDNPKSGCSFLWEAVAISEEQVLDGDILILKFRVEDTAQNGTYSVTVDYRDGDIADMNLTPISVNTEKGSISVSK